MRTIEKVTAKIVRRVESLSIYLQKDLGDKDKNILENTIYELMAILHFIDEDIANNVRKNIENN